MTVISWQREGTGSELPIAFQEEGWRKMTPDGESLFKMLSGDKPRVWLFTGDSITHGPLHTNGMRNYVEHIQERIRWELQRFHDVVINTGISGHTIQDIERGFADRIARFQPDAVFLMLGMNDCTSGPAGRGKFRGSFVRVIERIRALGAIPVLQTPNPIFEAEATTRSDLSHYVHIVREIALEERTVLIDHYAHWMTKQPEQARLRADWLNDAIHPNQHGHVELARKLLLDLKLFDEESPTCNLVLP